MQTALVIGASRGIGRQIAVTLAKNGYYGYYVGVAAKSITDSPNLRGTIYSVADEIKASGGSALPIQCDVRDESQIKNAIERCISEFGSLDYVIYNAGAITWEKVVDTPLKRFDLMVDVNVRGAYATIQQVLPYMLKRKKGKILLVSPPIYSRFFKGKTPYAVSKVGMTILMHGLANEIKDTGVSITSLWPATIIESQVTSMKNIPPKFYRKSGIFADACLRIGQDETQRLNGQALIDEDYLQSVGVTDFTKYRADPNFEPQRMMPKNFPDLTVAEEDETLRFKDIDSKL